MIRSAQEDLAVIRQRARVLSGEMAWRSRAADLFRRALADWCALLARMDADLAGWDDELAGLQWRLRQAATVG